jgi:hypothetical protein
MHRVIMGSGDVFCVLFTRIGESGHTRLEMSNPILLYLLTGKNRRASTGNTAVMKYVNDQSTFNEVFAYIFHHERVLAMKSGDAVEKITRYQPEYLYPHKDQLMTLLHSAMHIELKWHLALLLPRIPLSDSEYREVWDTLSYWTKNPNESKIVRVNSLQGLFDLAVRKPGMKESFEAVLTVVAHEHFPSLQARIRKLKKKLVN